MESLRIGIEDPLHCLCRSNGQRALFDDDLRGGRIFQDLACGLFPKLQVSRPARAVAKRLGGRIDADEYDIGLGNMAIGLCGKEKVLSACLADNFIQPRFINGELVRLPCRDAGLIDVHDDEAVFRTMAGNHRHSGSTDITSSDA